MAPRLVELILSEKIEAYSFPKGVPEHYQVQGMLMGTLAACRGGWGAFTGLIQLDVEQPQSATRDLAIEVFAGAKGRLTTGDDGKWFVLWYVDGRPGHSRLI